MYTEEEQAIRLVIKAFENKKRIKEDINLAFHSITVGFMLKDIGCDSTTVLSGLLHDIIEDSSYDYNYLNENFGKEIADNVLAISEDTNIKDWKERKIAFIKNLSNKSDNIIIIELADKLHNLLSDYDIWKENGKSALATLKTTYEMNKWYYLQMKELFNTKFNNNPLLDRYNEICEIYFKD